MADKSVCKSVNSIFASQFLHFITLPKKYIKVIINKGYVIDPLDPQDSGFFFF